MQKDRLTQHPLAAPLIFLAILLAPALAHRGALSSYFDSDDFGLINWARFSPFADFVRDLPSLNYPNGRPVGYAYYRLMIDGAGLRFAPWAISLWILGALNLALLWLVLRKLNFGEIEAAAGCLFFGMNAALFDAWWRPAFVYDVLATTFALLAMVAWLHRWWLASFLAFWLSLRSKEIGIVLPAVLLLYEMILGERKWKHILPFFVPAIVYGAFGVWFSLHAPHSPYTLSVAGIGHTAVFYASRIFSWRYGALALFVLLFFVRDPRFYFALGAALCEIGIYLLLPQRTLAVYLYLAATSVAIAVAALAQRYRVPVAAAVVMWSAWQYTLIHKQARAMLAAAAERRAYADAVRSAPEARVYAYADAPTSFDHFGGEYVIRVFHHPDAVYRLDDSALPANQSLTLLEWNSNARKLTASAFEADQNRFFERGRSLADWPADGDGYRKLPNRLRLWTYRPSNSLGYQVEACGEPGSEMHAFFDGVPVPVFRFSREGCLTQTTPVPAPDARMVVSQFVVTAGRVRVGAFGFDAARGIVSR